MLASKLWLAYSLSWLPVVVLAAVSLLIVERDVPRLLLALGGLLAVTAAYLVLTLRVAVTPQEWQQPALTHEQLRARTLLVGAMVLVVMSLLTLIPGAGPWWLMLYPVIGAGLALPVSLAVVSMAGMIALALVSQWLIRGEPELTILLQGVFGFTAVIVRRLSLAIGELHATREEVARLAVSEERLRFARDLHDVLGHSLSLIVLKSELAGRLLASAPERARTEVSELEHVAREALRQVRLAVAGYRQPSLAEELSAARQVLAASGIACTIDGPPPDLPAPLDRLAAWVVREGVTNVVRHSGARSCSIRFHHAPLALRVLIADDGAAGASSVHVNGSGLAGLRERAAAHGGTLSAGPQAGGGFALEVQVPLDGRGAAA